MIELLLCKHSLPSVSLHTQNMCKPHNQHELSPSTILHREFNTGWTSWWLGLMQAEIGMMSDLCIQQWHHHTFARISRHTNAVWTTLGVDLCEICNETCKHVAEINDLRQLLRGDLFPLRGHRFPWRGDPFLLLASFNCLIVGRGPGAFIFKVSGCP